MLLSSFDLNHGANIVKGYALAIGVAFAMWIVWTWWWRKLKADRLESQVRARQAFARLTHQVMTAPDVAIPVTADAGVPRQRYQKYMELLLTTADEILLLDPSRQWQTLLGRQLAPHAEYLSSPGFRDVVYGILSTETRQLVDRLVSPDAEGDADAAAQTGKVRQLRTIKG